MHSPYLGVSNVVFVTQGEDSAGTYRPADDVFEEAALKLQHPNESRQMDSSTSLTLKKDVLRFCSLDCVKDALGRICDVKGGVCFILPLPQN